MTCEPAFDYARTRPRVSIEKNGAVFQGAGLVLALSSQGRAARHRTRRVRAVRPQRGREGHLRPAPPGRGMRGAADGRAGERSVRGRGPLLARLAVEVHLPRALARDRVPLRAGVEAAHVRPHRRHRGRAHLQPAGRDRRGAQLGLPVQLAARRRVRALRSAAHRLHRGSGPLHGLARGALPARRAASTRCRSSTGSTAAPTLPRSRSITSRDTAARARCAWATTRTSSSSSTSTAS